ncbi:hypothetical protein HD554DRAFT_2148582 [Boletus coccyginus]|nr:hypothetical protein HD554DRAFT_2148582 [Boletus coccyginus]
MQHPQDFPDLPVRDFWQADILQAHMIIQQSCQHALEVLRQEDSGDPLRLRIHADHIRYQMIPLFGVLQTEVEDMEWAEESAHRLGELFCALSDAALTAAGHDNQAEIVRVTPFKLRYHHSRGRPAIEFDQEWLANAISPTHRLSLQTLARTLGVHRNTLRQHLQINGLVKHFSDITDAELDILVRHYKLGRPNAAH